MRQALSMAVDREATTDVLYNRDKFRSQGLEMEAARNTAIVPGYTGYWLDPANDKAFGPSSKYLNYNVAEAKKLMAAAGGNSAPVQLFFTPQQPPPGPRFAEVYGGMFSEAGFKVTNVPLSMNEWYSNYYAAYSVKDPATGKAKGYNGIDQIVERAGPTVAAALFGTYHKDSGVYKGVSPDGRNVEQGDPKLNDIIEKMKVEFDVPKQQALAQDAQRLIAEQAYHIPIAGSVKLFSVLWPAISNLGTYSVFGFTEPGGASGSGAVWTEGNINWWIDNGKAPLSRS
jgi:ABC-type transport system substrate-binding protein